MNRGRIETYVLPWGCQKFAGKDGSDVSWAVDDLKELGLCPIVPRKGGAIIGGQTSGEPIEWRLERRAYLDRL